MLRIPPSGWTGVSTLLVILTCNLHPTTASAQPRSSDGKPESTVLRIAYSGDGLEFSDENKVFLRHAAAPDITTLPGGDLLAIVDLADPEDADAIVMAVTRSADDGKTWLPARPLRLNTGSKKIAPPRHADLVQLPDGRFRLYFASPMARRAADKKRSDKSPAIIRSAITNNGLDYRLDPQTRLAVPALRAAHPLAASLGGHVHLYYSVDARRSATKGRHRIGAHHLISRGGRRFARMRPSRTPDVTFVGSIVTTEKGFTAYVSKRDNILALASKNGRDWSPIERGKFPEGWDPAVTRLADGSCVMIYATALVDKAGGQEAQTALVDAYYDDQSLGDEEWLAFDLAALDDEQFAQLDGDELEGDAQRDEQDTDFDAGSDTFDPDAMPEDSDIVALAEDGETPDDAEYAGETPLEGDRVASGTAQIDEQPPVDWKDNWDPIESGGFAPLPNFKHNVDYLEWYREYLLDHTDDNAHDAYAEFIPTEGFPEDDPRFKDAINSGELTGPPAPWDPADHPQWEQSYQEVKGLLDRYRQASYHEGYASPPGDVQLLFGILLPSLRPHRTIAKAAMANSWRKENGKVSPERMLDAWESTLRAAGHLERGATLIEDLVASADRKLVQDNARWALKHEVFSGDELEAALDTLREYDRSDEDPVQSVRGEHAFALDTVQHVFSPPTPDGQPRFNPTRFQEIFDIAGPVDGVAHPLMEMRPNDAHASIEAFDTHYRELAEKMTTGYPQVRAADIAELEERRKHASPLTEFLLPALGRVHQLRTREEASRRATQLAYATHLFKARNGRFPQSLDELPDAYGTDMKVDPFSGHHFGYRLTGEGPRIYSASENGIDDGGVHSPRWSDKPEKNIVGNAVNDTGDPPPGNTKSDDYVFYPPQR